MTSLFQEPVDSGLNRLNGEHLRELGQGMNRVAGDPRGGSCWPALDSHGPPIALVTLNMPNDSQVILPPANQAFSVSGTKRSSPTEEKYGLE